MKALRRSFLVFLVLLGGLPPVSGWTQVDITVTRTVIQRIPVAVVGLAPFHLESGGADLAAQASSILMDDLEFSMIFEVLPPSFLPFEARGGPVGHRGRGLAALESRSLGAGLYT